MKKFLLSYLVIITVLIFSITAAATEKEEVLISNLTKSNAYTRVATYKISAIDPTGQTNLAASFFPGFRGEDQLIIYTPNFGESTGTNEFGREASVVNGQVFGFNGADSFIPQGGYVISGHGKAKTWINQNLMEGAYIKIDRASMTIESVITPQSYIYKADHKINEVKKIMLTYKNSLPNYQCSSAQKYYDASFDRLQRAKYLIYLQDYNKALKELSSSLLLSEEAFYQAIPAVRNELHGVWIRPVEKNRSEIAKTIKELKKTGIDNIFLETYYQGGTIFPSNTMQKYGLTAQKKEFAGWDPLREWIKEAHEEGIKVHVWFQAFYAGNDNVSKTPGHILFVYPEWANVQRKNADEDIPKPSISEHNGYFLDPANHMVRTFLLALIDEIVVNYNIDGLNIDYVRYPKSLATNFPGYVDSTWGYTEYARNQFKKTYGKDPVALDEKSPLWQQWIIYRQEKVNEFVSSLKPVLKKPNIPVSAVIFPDIENTSETKLQNWSKWSENNYVDAFTPLIMSSDEYRASTTMREIRQIAGNNIQIYPGLFEPFTLGTPMNLLQQIVAVRKEGAAGIVIFDKAHLNDNFAKALRTRVLRN
ncbi:MAG TPA: family 10 glycosylhydrolase [Candidatus Gastranaerophilales bacterium]|nr:family 10 glycosylhydrolase [Candidatus Gastranaerophilales bacterium]